MKKMILRQIAMVALASLSLATTAQAKDRYLVIYKSQQGFAAMNNYFQTAEAPVVQLQKPLNALQAMIIKSSNSQALEVLKNHPEVLLVEKEMFTPAPRPVFGFKAQRATVNGWSDLADTQTDSQTDAQAQVPTLVEGVATPWGIKAVHAGEAWADSNAGLGAKVTVLDTGIDAQHPALKNVFLKGRNFFEGDNGLDPNDFSDREGHGTHVAGTIAGSYNEATGFTGVAPLAKVNMGRVCGELGCSSIAVADGINWAIEEKSDVISMSLGGPMGSSAQRMAIEKAEKAGVTVVAASGNGGNAKVSYPAAFNNVIAVGAVDVTITKTNFSQWGPELDIMAPGAAVVSSVPRGTGRDAEVMLTFNGVATAVKASAFGGAKIASTPKVSELVPAGLGKKEDFAAVNVEGKIALISRGEIAFSEKVQNAIAAKAIGVVIYNNVAGLMQGALTQDGSELDVAVVMIEKDMGLKAVETIKAGTAVTASIQTKASDYAMFDGTSMATPHVAGIIALMKAANKKATPAQIRQVIANTAIPMTPNANNEHGKGFIQADKAVKAIMGL